MVQSPDRRGGVGAGSQTGQVQAVGFRGRRTARRGDQGREDVAQVDEGAVLLSVVAVLPRLRQAQHQRDVAGGFMKAGFGHGTMVTVKLTVIGGEKNECVLIQSGLPQGGPSSKGVQIGHMSAAPTPGGGHCRFRKRKR